MGAQTSLTLNTKVYVPAGVTNGIASWVLRGDVSFGGMPSVLTQRVTQNLDQNTAKVRWMLTTPKGATEDSACACVGTRIGLGRVDVTLTREGLTDAEALDLYNRFKDEVATNAFKDAFVSLIAAY